MPKEENKISQVEADAISQKGLEDGKDNTYTPPNDRGISMLWTSSETLEREEKEDKLYTDAWNTGRKLK